jgi:hypothetical protein
MFVEKDDEKLLFFGKTQNRFGQFQFQLTEPGLRLAEVGVIHAGGRIDHKRNSAPPSSDTEETGSVTASVTRAAARITVRGRAILTDRRANNVGQPTARTRITHPLRSKRLRVDREANPRRAIFGRRNGIRSVRRACRGADRCGVGFVVGRGRCHLDQASGSQRREITDFGRRHSDFQSVGLPARGAEFNRAESRDDQHDRMQSGRGRDGVAPRSGTQFWRRIECRGQWQTVWKRISQCRQTRIELPRLPILLVLLYRRGACESQGGQPAGGVKLPGPVGGTDCDSAISFDPPKNAR